MLIIISIRGKYKAESIIPRMEAFHKFNFSFVIFLKIKNVLQPVLYFLIKLK